MITFVIFHVEFSAESKDQQAYHKHLLARRRYDFEELCNITFRSAKLFHPDCRRVLLTDTLTQFQLDDGVEIVRRNINPQNMMLERTYSQLKFLQEHDFQGDIFFLDSDMIINGNWDDVLTEKFDIGLTYDSLKKGKPLAKISSDGTGGYMPINGGVVIVRSEKIERAQLFFELLLDNYKSHQLIQHAGWWGDQHALIQTVGVDNFLNRAGDIIEVNGIRIKLLNAQTFNYSPRQKAYYLLRPLKAKLLHFRGSRKPIMAPYWKAYLEYKEKNVQNRFSLLLKGRFKLYLRAVRELIRINSRE